MTRETFDAARSLCGHVDPVRRELAAYILGQLGAVTLAADGQTMVAPSDERPFRAAATLVKLLCGLYRPTTGRF